MERIFSVSPKIESSIFNDTVFMALKLFYKGIYNMYILQVYLYNIYQVRFGIQHNVRRYVALAQSRGGACFCTRGAMQGYDVDLFILALAKTVTPAGVPGGSRGSLCR